MDNATNLVVLLSGSGSNFQAIVDHIQNGRLTASISAVISDQPEARGLTRATEAGIEAITVSPRGYDSKLSFEAALAGVISKYDPDLIVLAGFMRILSGEFVAQFNRRIMNIHPSLLPKHKGLNTHQRAIDAGDAEHGATVHFVTAKLDDGPRIIQAIVPVLPTDDAATLQQRVLIKEHIIYSQALQYFCDNRLTFNCDGKVYFDDVELSSPLTRI